MRTNGIVCYMRNLFHLYKSQIYMAYFSRIRYNGSVREFFLFLKEDKEHE